MIQPILARSPICPLKIIECPRDAMQGFKNNIPTEAKTAYLNKLLKVGFDTLDFGSFVSPKAVPQMADTEAVLKGLDLAGTRTKLLAIVANLRGAEQAADFDAITHIGFPLSVSEVFQQRNTRKTIAEALIEVAAIQNSIFPKGKTLVVYLSMAFGNPYGEPHNPETVAELTRKVAELGVGIVAPSDTVGLATPQGIRELFSHLIPAFPGIEFGAHLHSTPHTATGKIAAAYQAGCRRFDGAIRGFGGCPMAEDDLTGNIPTEQIVAYLHLQDAGLQLDMDAFEEAWQLAADVFAGT